MTINADVALKDIIIEALPHGQEKAVYLPTTPDRTQPGQNVVSFDQQELIARYAKENFAASMTWAEALQQMRTKFAIPAKAFDFGMVSKITQEWGERDKDQFLTPDQQTFCNTIVGALSGEHPHWDPGLRAKIDAKGKTLRDVLLTRFVTVTNRGEMNTAMAVFRNVYGNPTPRAHVLAEAGVAASGVTINDDGTVDPESTGEEEPF